MNQEALRKLEKIAKKEYNNYTLTKREYIEAAEREGFAAPPPDDTIYNKREFFGLYNNKDLTRPTLRTRARNLNWASDYLPKTSLMFLVKQAEKKTNLKTGFGYRFIPGTEYLWLLLAELDPESKNLKFIWKSQLELKEDQRSDQIVAKNLESYLILNSRKQQKKVSFKKQVLDLDDFQKSVNVAYMADSFVGLELRPAFDEMKTLQTRITGANDNFIPVSFLIRLKAFPHIKKLFTSIRKFMPKSLINVSFRKYHAKPYPRAITFPLVTPFGLSNFDPYLMKNLVLMYPDNEEDMKSDIKKAKTRTKLIFDKKGAFHEMQFE